MKKIIVLVVLIVLASIGGFLWLRQQPEQQVGHAVDQFLEHVEHRKISIRSKEDVHKALREVLADKIEFHGAWPIPTDDMTLAETLEKIDQFQGLTTLCEITVSEREIQIIGSKAQVYLTTEIHVAAGKNNQGIENWELIFDLEKNDDWRITGLQGKKLD